MLLKPISAMKKVARRRRCAIPKRCSTKPKRSFNELMDAEWEELVIILDKSNNKYELKTACCPGAQPC